MNDLVKIFLTAMLIDNVVLMRFIALCPFIGMSNDARKSVGMRLQIAYQRLIAPRPLPCGTPDRRRPS